MASSAAGRRGVVPVALLLVLLAGSFSATQASCCVVWNGGGMALAQVVEGGGADPYATAQDTASVRTGGDPVVRAWADDRGASARATALVGILLTLGVPLPVTCLAALLAHRGRPGVARRRHSIALRAPPHLRLAS